MAQGRPVRSRESLGLDLDLPEQPDATLSRAQLEDTVRTQLATLPPEQLELLKAAFYQGLSHSEIAKAFDLPLGTVKSRIRLAFARLRGQLEDGAGP